MFSGLVEKNKSLGAPVNSSLWGVHLNKQLSFENGLYCVRLPILQSGGRIKLIKPEELWVIMSEDYCPSCAYFAGCFSCDWCPRISLPLLAALGSLRLHLAPVSFFPSPPLWFSPGCRSLSLRLSRDARRMPCWVKRLPLSSPPHQQVGSWRKYHKLQLLLWQPELLLRKAVNKGKLL